MVSYGAAVGIALVALGMVLSPGPNMIYLVSRTVAQGRRAGFVSLLGIAVGLFIYLAAAAAGLTALFTAVPVLYLALKLLGAAYLLWLAWQTLRSGGSVFSVRPMDRASNPRLFSMGLVTVLLNPKIAVLYVSLLPQFIDPARGSVASQAVVLGLIQICIGLTVNCLIMLAAGQISQWLGERPLWTRIQRWLMASVLGALAVRMATDPK